MSSRKSKLSKIAKIWQLQLNLEYENKNSNIRLSFKDIGAFCEFLSIDFYTGVIGGGSGGMGFDLVDLKKHKGIEVKSCCTIQNAKCNNCKYKFNDLFSKKCPICGNSNFKSISDSRFGIDAKEFLEQYNRNLFDSFICCHIFLDEHIQKNNTIIIKMHWYKIDFTNPKIINYQLKYFTNQLDFGKKAHCNLLPNSYDFYKLCPKDLCETRIEINYKNIYLEPVIKEKFFKGDYLTININDPAFTNMEREKLKHFSKSKIISVVDFTINMDYRQKNLGKNRGDTRANIYNRV